MRVLVIGSGAVGGYYGGRLAHSGDDVLFIARGDHLAAIQSDGLRVRSTQGDFVVRSMAADRPPSDWQADLVLIAVKSYDTVDAARTLAPTLGPDTIVLSLQNGVDNEDKLSEMVGADRVIGGAAYLFSELVAPGVIEHTAGGRIVIGEMSGGESARVQTLAQHFAAAGIPCEVSTDIRSDKWAKLVFNAGLNGMTALLRRDIGRILACPETRQLLIDTMQEATRVATATGARLAPDVVERHLKGAEALGAAGSSMLQDIEKGKRLEVDAINGIIQDLGRQHGVPTPANRFLYQCLKLYDDEVANRHGSN